MNARFNSISLIINNLCVELDYLHDLDFNVSF